MDLKSRFLDRKNLRPLLIILSVVFGCGLFWLVGYEILQAPRFIVLDVPPTLEEKVNIRWYFTEYTTEKYEERGYSERHFVWQKRGYFPVDVGSEAWDSAIGNFDEWLAEEGWKRYQYLEFFDPCMNLAESSFLPKGKDGYVAYRRPNTIMFRDEPTICLAIWPSETYGSGNDDVVLTTINPSLFTRWNSAVDFFGVPPDE